MRFLDLAQKRYSVRKFKNLPVDQEKLQYVMASFRVAPSAVNYQPWHVIVVTETSLLEKIHTAYPRDWMKTAPCILVVLGLHHKSWKRKQDQKDHCDIDVAIAITHLTLAATEVGLGTCWVCNFDAKMISTLFHLPSDVEPIALIPIGEPDDQKEDDRPHTERMPLGELISWNEFQKK